MNAASTFPPALVGTRSEQPIVEHATAIELPISRSSAQAGAVAAPNYALDANEATAQRFLVLLDENAEQFSFRTVMETAEARKTGRGAGKRTAALSAVIAEFQRLNAAGAGVFVVVNDGGQKKTDIVRIRAVFADLDGAPLQSIHSCALEPHIIVETSPGHWHAYWLVDGLLPDQFKAVQLAIAVRFDADPSVGDLSRVMRLPGFFHRKGEPHLVRIIHESGTPPYSSEQIMAEFPTASGTTSAALPRASSTSNKICAGHRNSKLASIAGTMRRRGLGSHAINAALQIENAESCDPPLLAAEVADIANSIGRYTPAALLGPLPLRAVAKPNPPSVHRLPDHLRQPPGMIGEMADWMVRTARMRQPEMAIHASLAIGSLVMGQIYEGPTGVRSNMNFIATAQTGHGKGHSQNCAQRIIKEAGLEFALGGSSMASGSGLLSHLAASHGHAIYIIDEYDGILKAATAANAGAHLAEIATLFKLLYSASTSPLFKGKDYSDTRLRKNEVIA